MKSSRSLLLVALVACLCFRVVLGLLPLGTSLHTRVVESVPDGPEYVQLAKNLARNHVFSRDTSPPFRPELFRTPGYPLMVFPLFMLGPGALPLLLLLQLLLSLCLVWLVERFGRELGLSPPVPGIAALLVALSPNLSFLATKSITETLFTTALIACLLLLNRYRVSRRPADLLGTGLSAGLLVLVRPIATFFPLLLGLIVLGWSLRSRRTAWHALVPVLIAILVVAPWVLRNGRLTGRYILSTATEHNLFLYNAATVVAADKGITLAQARDDMREEAEARYGRLDTADEAGFWRQLAPVAWSRLLRRPLLTAGTQVMGFASNYVSPISIMPLLVHAGNPEPGEPHVFQRALAMLVRGRVGPAFRLAWTQRIQRMGGFALTVLLLAVLFQLVLMVAVLGGLFGRRWKGLWWLTLPVLYFTLLTGPVGEARLRAPIEPLLALLAAAWLGTLFRRGAADS